MGSGDGGKVCWRLGTREGALCEGLEARFRDLSTEDTDVRNRLTSRGSIEFDSGEVDFRFLELGGLESGDELGGEEENWVCWEGKAAVLRR